MFSAWRQLEQRTFVLKNWPMLWVHPVPVPTYPYIHTQTIVKRSTWLQPLSYLEVLDWKSSNPFSIVNVRQALKTCRSNPPLIKGPIFRRYIKRRMNGKCLDLYLLWIATDLAKMPPEPIPTLNTKYSLYVYDFDNLLSRNGDVNTERPTPNLAKKVERPENCPMFAKCIGRHTSLSHLHSTPVQPWTLNWLLREKNWGANDGVSS